jgi:hypothetical protein
MKRLLLILIFTLSFQSWTKADDIKDFEIEGISVGQSLLEYTLPGEIESIKSKWQYPNDNFIIYKIDKVIDLKKFDFLSVTVKKNDNKYIIQNVSGGIDYKNLNDCFEIKNEIKIMIESIFKPDGMDEKEYMPNDDKTGKSKIYGTQYYLKPFPSVESITINCAHMSKESNINRALKLIVASEDYANFLINDAYK